MSNLRREHGFLAAVGEIRARELFISSEFLVGVPLGLLLATGQTVWGTTELRVATTTAFISIVTALLGIVFAAFALVVAFLSPRFMSFLNESSAGVKTFFRPFMIAIGMQCLLLFLAVFHSSLGAKLDHTTELALFWVTSVIFAWNVIDIVSLARSVMIQATVKARYDEVMGHKGDE